MDPGSVAVIGLIAGLAGGAVGAALVGTFEAVLRRRGQSDHGWVAYAERLAPASETAAQPSPGTLFKGLDPDSRKVMTLARQEAIQNGHSYVGSENLAMAMRLYPTATMAKVWSQLAIDPDVLRRRIEATVRPILGPTPVAGNFTPRISRIVAIANTLAAERKREEVPPELLLIALADEGGGTGAHALASLGATAERVRDVVDEASS